MSDRELLELAAKAAGIKLYWESCLTNAGKIFRPRLQIEGTWGHGEWNPLDDDGDALRLACALGLTIECDFHNSDTCTVSETRGDTLADEQSGMLGEVISAPEFAATRRAIVRAAAEIARVMP